MDQKIATLSALCQLSKVQSPISDRSTRHLRVILSSFNEEILSEDEYEQLINSLEDDKYITRKNDQIWATREGAALTQAVSGRVLGETALDRLRRMIENYNQEGNTYVQNINEQLKSLQATREDKVREVDRFSIRVAGLIVEVQHKYSDLYAHNFRVDHQMMRNEEALDSEISYSARKFMRATGCPIITWRDDTILQVVGPMTMHSFTVFGQELHASTIETVRREQVPGWNSQIVSLFMERNLRELGYIRSYWPGRTFVKYRDFERTQTNIGCLRECESFQLDFMELQEDQFFVWIESYTSPTKRALDFLRENVGDITDKQDILSCLEDLKLRSIPSGSEVELKDVMPSKDMTIERVSTTDSTFVRYWERTHGIELTEQLQPILVVKGFNQDFHYPAEMIYIDRNSLEKRLGRSRRRPKPESPKERYEKIQDLFFSIKDLQSDLNQYLAVVSRRYAPTVQELCELGAFRNAIRIRQPMLEFQGGSASIDPLDVFSPDYVPVCGRKNITLTHLVLPSDTADADIEAFVQELQRAFRAYGFGKIKKPERARVIRYGDSADIRQLESKIRDLDKLESDINIAIAVVPDDDDTYYYSLKRLLPISTGTPLQCVRLSTFREILSGSFRGFQYLCMEILIKVLREGESIWNLSATAGLSNEKTLFVGIGFSRYPRERKVSKCAAVLHSAHGDRVSWEVFATLQERTISKQWFDNLLRRIRGIVEKEKPSRLLFYRTGKMFPQESEAVKSSLTNCHWLSSIKVSFVSIMDGRNYRFYLYDRKRDRYRNLPAGYAIVVDDQEAFLSSSNYDERELRHGTVIPVRLKLEIGDETITDLLKEYHDLTYLNWQAPTTTAKHPFVVTVADRFAELTREGIPAESMFYLDI
jgi:hypothetical protein